MKTILSLVLAVFIAMPVTAQDSDTVPASASILTADTADPRYIEQMGYITERLDVLTALDVVVITDTDPDARSDLRKTLRPRGFGLVLIGKDGVIYLRKPAPWHVREIIRTIDKLPMRQQELRERPGDS